MVMLQEKIHTQTHSAHVSFTTDLSDPESKSEQCSSMPSFPPNLLTRAIIIFDWHATSVHYSVRIDIPPPLLLLMKKRSERRKHCTVHTCRSPHRRTESAMAVVRQSQNSPPRRRPLPGGAGPPKFNQLEMVTTCTYRPSLVKIDACNFELSW